MARLDMTTQPSGPAGLWSMGQTMMERGLRHAAGRDAPADLVAAHMCFNVADREGVEDAAYHRQAVADEMSKAEIAAALRAARDFLASLN